MFLKILQSRRSIRRFLDKPVEKQHIDTLMQAALLSASSRSIRPWEFVVIDDPETIARLSRSKLHGSSFLSNAPLAAAVLGIPKESDVWIEDASIAASNLLLAAEDLGLGACWIQIRLREAQNGQTSEEFVKETLHIPEDRSVEAIIALGYPAEEKSPVSLETLQWEKVSYNKYGR